MHVTNESPRHVECDPVCGRELTREQALFSSELKGHTYLFCSERCRMLFSIRPAWFVERTIESERLKAS
jgi:YHS domain-containing protein